MYANKLFAIVMNSNQNDPKNQIIKWVIKLINAYTNVYAKFFYLGHADQDVAAVCLF